MEINVWQLYAQVAKLASNLLNALKNLRSQPSGGVLPSVPESDANITSISTNATTLAVVRDPKMETADALFGRMDYDGKYLGITMERKAVAIPEGTYPGRKRDSAHFGMRVVGIDVPNRTDIECHPANLPLQLNGCIALGESKDGDAIDNSKTAFQRMMNLLPESFAVMVG